VERYKIKATSDFPLNSVKLFEYDYKIWMP